MNSDKYGERRGAAFGLAGVVKGYGISCLKKYGITAAIRESLADRYIHTLVVLVLLKWYIPPILVIFFNHIWQY
jgi:hypothetical protein